MSKRIMIHVISLTIPKPTDIMKGNLSMRQMRSIKRVVKAWGWTGKCNRTIWEIRSEAQSDSVTNLGTRWNTVIDYNTHHLCSSKTDRQNIDHRLILVQTWIISVQTPLIVSNASNKAILTVELCAITRWQPQASKHQCPLQRTLTKTTSKKIPIASLRRRIKHHQRVTTRSILNSSTTACTG